MRRLVALAAALVVASTVAACGGDDDGYVDAMEEACDERDLAFEAIVQPVPAAFDAAYMAHVVEGSVEIIEDYLAAVEEIGPPGGDLDDEHEEYVALLTTTLERYEAAVGDDAAIAELFNREAPEFRALEEALGLETCGTAGNGQDTGG